MTTIFHNKQTSKQANTISVISMVFLATIALPLQAGNAVSESNAKLQALGGSIDSNDAKVLLGSFTTPVSQNLGFQADALVGDIDSNNAQGYSIHGFWRDSDKVLLGLNISQVKSNGNKLKRYGLEGEYYLPSVTLAGTIGKQEGDVPDAEYGSLDLTWYPQDNLALNLGASEADGVERQHIGAEYQTGIKGLSVYADVAQGNGNYDHAMLGLTYYFGKQKSLKQRHRQDDPRNPLLNAVQDVDAYFVQNPPNKNNNNDSSDSSGQQGTTGGFSRR